VDGHAREPPLIDVHQFQQEASAALLEGHNPYELRYRNLYGPGSPTIHGSRRWRPAEVRFLNYYFAVFAILACGLARPETASDVVPNRSGRREVTPRFFRHVDGICPIRNSASVKARRL
jgi:hypothetical protein